MAGKCEKYGVAASDCGNSFLHLEAITDQGKTGLMGEKRNEAKLFKLFSLKGLTKGEKRCIIINVACGTDQRR